MGMKCIAISAGCTFLSFVGLQFWTEFSLERLKTDGLLNENYIHPENASRAIELLLGSYATIGLLANFVLNVFVILVLCLKVLLHVVELPSNFGAIFFVELYPSEARKLAERLINYVVYKGTFLPLVVPPTIYQAGLWSTWLTVLCTLKMFQAMARDRLERLNASPSARPWTYFRVYSALLFVLSVDVIWIKFCLMLYRTMGSSMYLLLFFEPLSIAFETMQAILVHGFQLLDIWMHHSAWNSASCQRSKFFDSSAVGSLWEWKSTVIRNMGFSLDMATLLMALGHYVDIWWLHGMAFHLVDAVLFLNIRALLSAILKRIKGYIKLRMALGTLHAALPDATHEELQAYDDECAICREPMAKAKRLKCNHLFHLACLRSWLDQGLNDNYSCPTCRKPLFAGRAENETNPRTAEVLSDEQLARQISAGLNRPSSSGHTFPTGVFPNQTQNPLEGSAWRGAGMDSNWLQGWPSQDVDGAGPSTSMGSVGLGRVQMMMSHLGLEDASWSLWPMNTPQASTSGTPTPTPTPAAASGRTTGGLHIRSASRSANDNITNMLAMAETVREVLPHVPDELIYQDLQRTNSVTVTVNNLLQM